MKHVIVGSGPAGVTAAETLRKADPAAEITLLCGEGEPPYARMAIPYLLKGDIDEAGTFLRKDRDHWARLRIDLVEARARGVDTSARVVDVGKGHRLPYDRLLVATGSRPSRERIPGIDLPGVRTCWTLKDARALLAGIRPGTRVVQMGAGFVGCIIMEGLLARGADLTVLVRSGYMVRRMMNPTASGLIRRWCEAKGVRVLTRTQPKGIAASGSGLKVDLGEGRTLDADLYLSVVGVDPNLDFLAGLALGILLLVPLVVIALARIDEIAAIAFGRPPRRFAGTPVARARRGWLRRNVCVALGNAGDERALPSLQKAANEPESLVAEHARWAVEQIQARRRPRGGGAETVECRDQHLRAID